MQLKCGAKCLSSLNKDVSISISLFCSEIFLCVFFTEIFPVIYRRFFLKQHFPLLLLRLVEHLLNEFVLVGVNSRCLVLIGNRAGSTLVTLYL